MRKKGFFITLFVIVLGFISIYLFSVLDIQLQESAQKAEVQKYNLYRVLEVIVLIVFGILIEYKKVISIHQNGVQLNTYRLVVSLALFILLILPYNITAYLGIAHPNSIKGTISFIVNSTSTRGILSVLAGILIIRSFLATKPRKETF